jgi:hypothetical protein
MLLVTVFSVALALSCAGGASAMHFSDSFATSTGGISNWTACSGGTSYVSGSNSYFRINYNGDSSSWNTNWVLDNTFSYQVNANVDTTYGSSGTSANADLFFAMNDLAPSVSLLVDAQYSTSNQGLFTVQWYNTGNSTWTSVLNSGWMSGVVPNMHIQAIRPVAGCNYLTVSYTCTNGFSYSANTATIDPTFLDNLTLPGLREYDGMVDFSTADLWSPIPVSLIANIDLKMFIGNYSLMNLRVNVLNSSGQVVATQTVTPTSEVTPVTFTTLAAGNYTVSAIALQYLSASTPVTIVANQTSSVSLTMLNGDINGDNFVEDQDYSIMGASWYQTAN